MSPVTPTLPDVDAAHAFVQAACDDYRDHVSSSLRIRRGDTPETLVARVTDDLADAGDRLFRTLCRDFSIRYPR